MFFVTKPTRAKIAALLSAQHEQTFSYPEVGFSREQKSPRGFTVDHNRVQLGTGAAAYELAKRAIREWKMFEMPWVQLCWPNTPIEPGALVAVLVSHLGFWSLNFCRIIYVIEENAPIEKYGFAYGTLRDHAERGEERFTVEFDPRDQSVCYDLYAFSRPSPLARLAYPFTRHLQKRFACDSKAAMVRSVKTF
jgi:uncharacterized protein (UPF0548 family)